MSPSMLSSLESVLAKMQAISDVASNRSAQTQKTYANESGFAVELSRSLQRLSTLQNQAQDQAKAFESGVPGIALNDVMIDLQTASVAFQTTVQVRNRLVAAYQEIASMPV